jgi:hypothetical protein
VRLAGQAAGTGDSLPTALRSAAAVAGELPMMSR